MLSPYDYPVDRVMQGYTPCLPLDEIKGLHESGLTTDEDGETVVAVEDDDTVPFGWRIVEADDPMILSPESV